MTEFTFALLAPRALLSLIAIACVLFVTAIILAATVGWPLYACYRFLRRWLGKLVWSLPFSRKYPISAQS
jgi:hypothetical protein